MAERIAKKTKYYTADRSRLVDEDDPAAAFLFVRAGSPVNEAEAKRLKYNDTEAAEEYDAAADHEANHANETDAEAQAKRAALFTNASKAVKAPPSDKALAEPEAAGLAADEPKKGARSK